MPELVPPTPSGPLIVETRTSTVWVGPDGYARLLTKEGVHITEADVQDLFDKTHGMKEHWDGKYVISWAPKTGSISRAARKKFASPGPDCPIIAKATAVVVPNALARILGSFFLIVNKPVYATKLFPNEQKAAVWLKSLDL